MNFKSSNFKIYLGSAYLIVLLTGIYFLFSNFNISDLASYEFIRENKDLILKYKENNIYFLTIIFFIIVVLLNLLLTPMLLPTLVIGFIFGKWLGTLILLFGNTIGASLLYLLARTFFGLFYIGIPHLILIFILAIGTFGYHGYKLYSLFQIQDTFY